LICLPETGRLDYFSLVIDGGGMEAATALIAFAGLALVALLTLSFL
jgi:hypothetical protein